MKFRRVSFAFACIGLAGAGVLAAAEGPEKPHGIYRGVSTAVKFDISPPLRSIAPVPSHPEAGGYRPQQRPGRSPRPPGPRTQ